MLAYFLPPLALLATPEWLLRVHRRRRPRRTRAAAGSAKPVVAGVLFNLAVMVTHIPGVVNASVESPSPVLHYLLHVMVVSHGPADVDAGLRPVQASCRWARRGR